MFLPPEDEKVFERVEGFFQVVLPDPQELKQKAVVCNAIVFILFLIILKQKPSTRLVCNS